ncbi:MAG: hypothetical protein WCS27_00390 [Victivallaceae bacterium]
MAKQSVLIYSVPLKILKEIVKARRRRGETTSQCSVVQELIFKEAEKEGIKRELFFDKQVS